MCRQCIDEMAVRDLEEFDLSDFLERFDEALDDLPLEVIEMIEEDPEKVSDFELLREMTFKYSLEEYFEENPKMEEVSHSPYFMQKFDKTIQNLSPELRRKVYKDYVAMMQRERGKGLERGARGDFAGSKGSEHPMHDTFRRMYNLQRGVKTEVERLVENKQLLR